MQPGPQRDVAAERPRFLDEDQERGLEGILGIVRILQDAPADAQDHRPVPRHQDLERRGVLPGGEALEQLRIGESRDDPTREEAVDLPQGGAQSVDGHASRSPAFVPHYQ